MTKVAIAPGDYAGLHKEVVSVVESARRTAARNVNAVMTAAYWEIGRRIVASEQGGQARAGYGQALIARLADDLTRRFGRGFGRANLASMRAFYSARPAAGIFRQCLENLQLPKMSRRRLENRCRRKTSSTPRQRRPITWRWPPGLRCHGPPMCACFQ